MHWLTILTALAYSATFAFLVFVKGWELPHAAIAVVGTAFGVALAILIAIMLMPRDEVGSFWAGFKTSCRAELIGLWNLLRFK